MIWSTLLLTFHLSNLVTAWTESGSVNPCISTKCEKISTELMSKHQYSVSRRKYNPGHHQDPRDGSWIRFLRKRRRKKHEQQRGERTRRSPTRTIVSVNTEYKTFKKNKKCHKYAMFKVSKHHDEALSRQVLIRYPVAEIYSWSIQWESKTKVLWSELAGWGLWAELNIIYKDMPVLYWWWGTVRNICKYVGEVAELKPSPPPLVVIKTSDLPPFSFSLYSVVNWEFSH